MRIRQLIQACLTAGMITGPVLYPASVLAASVLTERRRTVLPAPRSQDRFVSVVIAAYRERGTIGEQIERLLRTPGSPVAEVIVVVDDDSETAAVARQSGGHVIERPVRLGKSTAVNLGVTAATSDVLFLTDANTEVATDNIRRLAEHIRCGRLDVVGGVRMERGRQAESLYWHFENAVKMAEDRLGGSLALVGDAIALPRASFRPIPHWVRADDYWIGLDAARRGLRVSVDARAPVVEPSASPSQQFERRRRIGSATMEVNIRETRLLYPGSLPVVMLLVHKVWRSTAGPVCQLVLACRTLRRRTRSPLTLGVLAVTALATGDYILTSRRDVETGNIRSIFDQALGMPIVILAASLADLLVRRGRGTATWVKIDR